MSDPIVPLRDLPNRLRVQANNVEEEGYVSAARLMREAAAEIDFYRNINDEKASSETS
jgi:hypothetical protein